MSNGDLFFELSVLFCMMQAPPSSHCEIFSKAHSPRCFSVTLGLPSSPKRCGVLCPGCHRLKQKQHEQRRKPEDNGQQSSELPTKHR